MADIQSTLRFGDDDSAHLAGGTEGPTLGIMRDPAPGLASGIYRILCVPTGKVYIGSAVKIAKRWARHLYCLTRGEHHSRPLQNAWRKHGAQAFTFEVIEWVEPARLIEREQTYIEANHATSYGFNICPTAGSQLGMKHTEETRRKYSEARRGKGVGRTLSEETKQKISDAHRGMTHTEETRQKLRDRQITEETRRKIGEAGKRRTPSEETRRKMSEANTGRKHTEEAKRKIGEAKRGKTHTEEHRRNNSEARRGKKKSAESIRKRTETRARNRAIHAPA